MTTIMPARFTSFREFYPYYLGEHRHPVSRRLHVIGTLAMLAIVVAAIALREWWLILPAVILAYGCAWVGHYVFEKNRPATFRHPLYSLRGDFAMLRDVLLRRTPR
ncbi:MAG: Mpo1-like protein [Steroidobacteraceae bacterium]